MISKKTLGLVFILCFFILQGPSLCGQSFALIRVEGSVRVKKDGVWKSYSSAKRLQVLSAVDSIEMRPSHSIRIKDAQQKVYTLYAKESNGFKGTVKECLNLVLNDRHRHPSLSVLPLDIKERAIGEAAMTFRGSLSNEELLSIVSYISFSGKVLNSKDISIRRIRERKCYYYSIRNTSDRDLYISVFEVENQRIVETDADMMNILIPAGQELALSDILFFQNRKKNGFYAIGSSEPLSGIQDLIGKNLSSTSQGSRMSFNYIVAGRR